MIGNDVRKKYLEFFQDKNHKIIPPAPLVLKDDPTTLFTSSGMQPLVPYLMGMDHPGGKRLADSQPSLRAQDIEEVGDNRHTTFFEMLGNWSLGDYFKKEQIVWFWEFITKELGLPKDKIYVTVFEGNDQVPEDKESYEIWQKLGVAEDHIFKYGVKKNWWSRAGTPEQMPDGEIGGPDTEVFFEFTQINHNNMYGEVCHPNCDCGRFLEIGNSVFMQYKKENGKLIELPQKNVDFGGGLERLAAATHDDPDVFKTDLFSKIVKKIEDVAGKSYLENEVAIRIITDHVKASTFLIKSGVIPSNKLQGYILRRLLRRSVVKLRELKTDFDLLSLSEVAESVIDTYKGVYFEEGFDVTEIKKVINEEVAKFAKNLEKGIVKIEKADEKQIDTKFAFDLFTSEGFPFEITQELALKRGVNLSKEEFDNEMKKHQDLSRESSKDKFKIK